MPKREAESADLVLRETTFDEGLHLSERVLLSEAPCIADAFAPVHNLRAQTK